MTMDFNSVADDFYVNLNIQTTLALSNGRETVLHFFEALQKQFGPMRNFFQREGGEFVLEADRSSGSYRWLELGKHQLSSGFFNPPDLAGAYELHRWVLERSVYYLGVSGLDVESLDVVFGFNLEFLGNRDELVARALLGGSPPAALAGEPDARMIDYQPSMIVALDEQCSLQARLAVETRNSTYQVRTGQWEDEPISVYFTIRRHPGASAAPNLVKMFAEQCDIAEDLCRRIVIPQVVQPIAAAQ